MAVFFKVTPRTDKDLEEERKRKAQEVKPYAVYNNKTQAARATGSAVASLAGRIAESARTAAEQTQNKNILPLPILNSKALNSLPVTPKKAIQSAQTAALREQALSSEENRERLKKAFQPELEKQTMLETAYANMGQTERAQEARRQISRIQEATGYRPWLRNLVVEGGKSIGQSTVGSIATLGETGAQMSRNTQADNRDPETMKAYKEEELARIEMGNYASFYGVDSKQYKAAEARWKEKKAALESVRIKTAVDPESWGMQMMRRAADSRQKATENLSGTSKFVADTALSVADNLTTMPLAVVNPALPLAAMGAKAAGQRTWELNEQGISPDEAFLRGVGSGLIEAGTEKLPLDAFLDMVKAGSRAGAEALVKQVLTEGGEEGASYFLNAAADALAGDPEATFDNKEFLKSIAGGMLSGGMMTAGGMTAGNLYEGVRGRQTGTNRLQAANPVQINENAASNDATESTVINTNPAVHTAAEQAVIDEYQDAVDEDLKETFESYLKNPKQGFSRYNISDVSERQANDAAQLLGGDYKGYRNAINSNGIIHVLNEHGPNGAVDHSMADLNDPARIAYVLNHYDHVEQTTYKSGEVDRSAEFRTKDNMPAPMLKYSKKVNGTYYVVEAIPESKHKKFWVVSAYMETDGGTQAPNAIGPENTPDASLASSPSVLLTPTISQDETGVNTQRVYSNSIDTDRANDTQRAHSTQEGAQNNEAVFNGSGERDAGLDTGRQTGRMAEGAGRNTGGKTQREYATERENRYAASSAQRQYVEALGQEADVYPEALYDEDLRRTADELREQGIEPVFFLGDITVTSGGKKLKSRGYYEDGRAYVKINNGVTARQIARHEAFHELAERDAGLVSRLAEQIVQRGGERELKQFVAAYTQAYQGCYGSDTEAYIEEICADAYAGVNGFSYADTVTEQAQTFRNTAQNENAAQTLHTENKAGGRAMINPNFETAFDNWVDNRERWGNVPLQVGKTSEALKSIGISDRTIYWDTKKIQKTMKEHPEMSIDILKQVPQIIEDPIIIMESKQNVGNRITMFGEVYDTAGTPVLAVVELEPTSRQGALQMDTMKLVSSYGKKNSQNLINTSKILYLDPNKNRTNNWLASNRLQLPFVPVEYGSINKVSYSDHSVNNQYMQKAQENTPDETKDDGQVGRSSVDVSEYLEKAGLDPKKLSRMTDEEIVGLPEKKPGSGKAGDSRSRFAESVEKQNYFGEQLREAARKDSSIQSYDRIANDETMRKAADALDDGGRGEIEAWFRKDAKQATAQDIAKGFLLMDRYQKAGDYDGMIAAAQKLREMGTAAGQTVQMFSIMGRMTPEGMLAYAQKTLDDAKERFLENKARAWVERNKGRFTLTEEETQKIVDNVKKAQKLPEGRDKKILLAEIPSLIADKIPKNFGQKARTYVRTNLLLNPKTQLRNIQGNAIIAPMHAMSDFVGSGVDRMIAKKTGVRTTGSSTRGMLSGAKKGLYESFDDFRRGINTRNAEGDRFEIGEGNSFSNKSPIGKALNALDRVNSFLLDAGDRPFYEAWFIKSLNNQMRLNHVNKPTAEMISIATNDALRRTWQDANAWTKAASGVRRTLNLGRGYGPGDMIMPFVKTPMNLAKAIVDFSPAGLVKTLARDGRALTIAMQNGKATAQMQRDFVTNLSNGIVGTILVGTAYMLAANGYLSGAGDEDKDVRKFEENVLGIKPYSVKIGDKSYSYEWAQPVGGLLAIAADLEQTVDEGKITEYFRSGEGLATLLNQILSAGKSGISVLAEQSFLQSIQTLFGEDDLMTGMLEAAAEEPVKWLPASSLMNQIASFGDEAVRSSYDNQSPYVTTAVNKVKARIPGLRQTLPENVDVLGRTIENQNDFFNVFFNPANTAQAKPTEASNEMYRLYKATGDKSLLPHAADYSLTYQETKYILDGEERAEYQRVMGKTAHEGVADLLESRSYRNMTDEKKAAAIKLVYEYASAQAKAEYLEEQGVNYETDGFAEKMQELSKYGVKAGEFAPIYLTQNECEGEHAGYQKANVVINSTLARRKQNAILNMQMSDSQKRRFQEAAIRFGMDERRFMAIYWKLQTIQSDRDQNGKPANNAKEKRIRWLRENGYSNAEAWAVYEIMCANG